MKKYKIIINMTYNLLISGLIIVYILKFFLYYIKLTYIIYKNNKNMLNKKYNRFFINIK